LPGTNTRDYFATTSSVTKKISFKTLLQGADAIQLLFFVTDAVAR
jgi:hypothetical protein